MALGLRREHFVQHMEKRKGWLREAYITTTFRRCLKKNPQDAAFVGTYAQGYTKINLLQEAFKAGHEGIAHEMLKLHIPEHTLVASSLLTGRLTQAPDWLWDMAKEELANSDKELRHPGQHAQQVQGLFTTLLRKTGGEGPVADKFLQQGFDLKDARVLGHSLGTPMFEKLLHHPWTSLDVTDAWAVMIMKGDTALTDRAMPQLKLIRPQVDVRPEKWKDLLMQAWKFGQPKIAFAIDQELQKSRTPVDDRQLFGAKLSGGDMCAFSDHPTQQLEASALAVLIKGCMENKRSEEFVDALYRRHKSLGTEPWVRAWTMSLNRDYNPVKVKVVGRVLPDMTAEEHTAVFERALKSGHMPSILSVGKYIPLEDFRAKLHLAKNDAFRFEAQKLLAQLEKRDLKKHVDVSHKSKLTRKM